MTTARRRTRHKRPTLGRRRWLLVVPAFAVLALVFAPGPASASQGADTIQQNWELTADHVSYTMPPTNAAIYYLNRGTLPGGTTGFDPAPTVTMDVVAKISGASGSGAGWNLKLSSGATDLTGNLFFGSADSAYTLKSISVPWSTVDRGLSELDLTPATNTSGTIDVQKAYLNIQQSGIVKATIGRVPMGTHQPQVTTTSFAQIADPYLFTYHAADYDPAPTIKLLAGGQITTCGDFYVRLWDRTASSAVTSFHWVLGTAPTQESGALSLIDGHTYELQDRIDTTSCTGSPGNGPSVNPVGEFTNADLEFFQSTTDAAGIVKTEAYYPSVTTATDVAQNNTNLGFKFATPLNRVPNAATPEWDTTAKATTGTVAGDLIAAGASTPAAYGGGVSGGSYVNVAHKVGTSIALPTTAGTLDTRTDLSTGATGRIAGSLLREVLLLRDLTKPVLTNFRQTLANVDPANASATTKAISPQNNDGRQDSVTYAASITDFSPTSWTLAIKPPGCSTSACAVRTFIGTTTPPNDPTAPVAISAVWNGRDGSNNLVSDGTYTISLSVTDGAGNVADPIADLQTVVDNTAPVISNFVASATRISPYAGPPSNVTYTATLSEPTAWSLDVSSGNAPYQGTGTVSATWNGRTYSGAAIDGAYPSSLAVVDIAGTHASATGPTVTVDITPPTVTNVSADRYLSRNPASTKSSSRFQASLSDPWPQLSWTLRVKTLANTVIRTWTGSSPTVDQTWDGTDTSNNPVSDGNYTWDLQASDGGNNHLLNDIAQSVTIDSVAPVAATPSPGVLANTLWKQPAVSVGITDDRAGIDAATADLRIDGTTVSATYLNNAVQGTPAAPLSANIDHTLSLAVKDNAGNPVSYSSLFRVIGIQQQSAAVSIPGVDATTPSATQCQVNCSVSFAGAVARVGAHTTTLSSSIHPGTGVLHRPLDLSTAIVTWHLPGGVNTTSSANLTAANTSETLNVPDASDSAIALSISTTDTALGTVSVTVPAGIPPSTPATLSMASLTQAPACADSLQAPDPSTCGGPASAGVDPLNANLQNLYMTYAPSSTPLVAGDDLPLTVKVKSTCTSSCGSIALTLNYRTPWGTTEQIPQTLTAQQSQAANFTIPGNAIRWWDTTARTPYAFGYWFTATQTQGANGIIGRSPVAANAAYERQVSLHLQATVNLPDGTPAANTGWQLNVVDIGEGGSNDMIQIASGGTDSNGALSVTIPTDSTAAGQAVLNAASHNRQVVNLLLSAVTLDSAGASFGEESFTANIGDTASRDAAGLRAALVDPGVPGEAATIAQSVISTANICQWEHSTANCYPHSSAAACIARNDTDMTTDNYPQQVGNIFTVNYGYGNDTVVHIGTAHSVDNWVQFGINVTGGPLSTGGTWQAVANAGAEVRTGNSAMNAQGVNNHHTETTTTATAFDVRSYWDMSVLKRWYWYANPQDLYEYGTCVYEQHQMATQWNPFGKEPDVGRLGATAIDGSRWFDDCVDTCTTSGQWIKVDSENDYFRDTGNASYNSGSFCLFVCVGNQSTFDSTQELTVSHGTQCAGGWYVYPHGSSTLATSPQVYVDSGDPGAGLNAAGTKPAGC